MIHTKSLIQRLGCIPWLLAACFALAWTGEAQANRLAVNPDTDAADGVQYHDIKLELDTHEVLENALVGDDAPAEIQIKVTATRLKTDGAAKDDDAAKGDAAMQIALGFLAGQGTVTADSDPTVLDAPATSDATDAARFRISMPFLVIPKDKAKGEAIITFVPLDDAVPADDAVGSNPGTRGTGADPDSDVRIWITGDDGLPDTDDDDQTIRPAYFTLRDNERDNGAITLSFDVTSLSKEADRTKVVVTASLDAKPAEHDLEFAIKDVAGSPGATSNASGLTVAARTADPDDEGFSALDSDDKIASRDAFYKGEDFGNIKIEKGKMSATKTIYINPENVNESRIIDNTWIALGSEDSPIRVNPDGKVDADPGTADNPADSYDLPIIPGFIKLTKDALPKVEKVEETSPQVREDGGADQAVTVTVTLKAAAPAGGITVSLDLIEEAGRDTDYYAEIVDSSLDIAEGEKSGDAIILIDPIDNDKENSDWTFKVSASVPGTGPIKSEVIKIIDDEDAATTIELRADPDTISEIDGESTITITAYVNGKAFDAAVNVPLTVLAGNAVRDLDYVGSFPTLVIPAGSVTATREISITPTADETNDEPDGSKTRDETIVVGTTVAKDDTDGIVKVGDKDIEVKRATITLKDEKTPPPDPSEEEEVGPVAFDTEEATVSGTVGDELEKVLPEAAVEDEEATATYLLSGDIPGGLSFNAATRTISGTPEAAGTDTLTYFATDGTNLASMAVSITISDKPTPDVNLEGITSTHTSIPEEGGEVTITLTVTLEEAAGANGEDVSLSIVAPTKGERAVRDVDFDATLDGSITIAAGATSGTATLTVTPRDNETGDGHKAFGVRAESSSGHTAFRNIGISDNESTSESIVLSVDPDEVSGGTETEVTVTASLDGLADEDNDITVSLSISSASSAKRDVDYSAIFAGGAEVTIPAGSRSNSTTVTITAADNDDGDKTIILVGSADDDLDMGSAAITLVEGMMDDDDGMADDGDTDDGGMADDGDMDDGEEDTSFTVDDQTYTAGAQIDPLELPAVEGAVTYEVEDLPAGLSFDAETRTISGTPEAAGTATVRYYATDSAGNAKRTTFTITVNPALSFGDAFGAGKANPASEHGDADFAVVVGQELNLPLPGVTGGTPPLNYDVVGLPAGLVFDKETRTVSGVPEAVTDAPVEVTYIVTDGNGATISLPILVAVIPPPLAAPPSLEFVVYAGADGQGTQGGFVLLTWELSENHAGIDGYRIYRELPVLGNEMVPWAFVDAVPEVEIGRAIVATLDGINTSWGIAAERGGQTTVIVSGNQSGKRVPEFAGLNADARMYLDAQTALPSVGEEFVLDVRVADFVAVDGYGLQMQYDASQLEFVRVQTEQPLATPQVLAEAGVLTVAAYGDVVSEGEVALSLVFRPTTEIENTVVEIIDTQMYDSEVGFNSLALPLPLQVQTLPAAFALANNYPNPFNPATTIKYALPQAADVELTVYNVVGQVVRTLVAEHQSAGRYVVEWDATNDSGRSLSSGMYFYRLEAGGEFFEVKKMLLLK